MNKSIRRLIISIIVTFSVILVSIPLWQVAQGRTVGIIASNYSELPISIKVGIFESLLIIDNENAANVVKPTEIVMRNRNGIAKKGKLSFLVEKKSTVPTSFLRVSIDGKVYDISSINYEEDKENYYYELEEYEFESYETKTVEAKIWLSTDSTGLDSSSILITNFVIR